MIDKEWLEKIYVAYRAYPYPSIEIDTFIQWLYRQYGIIEPGKKSD